MLRGLGPGPSTLQPERSPTRGPGGPRLRLFWSQAPVPDAQLTKRGPAWARRVSGAEPGLRSQTARREFDHGFAGQIQRLPSAGLVDRPRAGGLARRLNHVRGRPGALEGLLGLAPLWPVALARRSACASAARGSAAAALRLPLPGPYALGDAIHNPAFTSQARHDHATGHTRLPRPCSHGFEPPRARRPFGPRARCVWPTPGALRPCPRPPRLGTRPGPAHPRNPAFR
jgi:hypothetical protein